MNSDVIGGSHLKAQHMIIVIPSLNINICHLELFQVKV